MKDTDPNRPDVVADNGAHLHIANALYLWEGGEFSDWAVKNGFPLTIGGETFNDWNGVEDALANFKVGPFDPRELED
jgi:hypothetical protein